MPAIDGHLAGDQQRAAIVAVVDDLEQIAALLGIERFWPPIIDDQQPDAFGHRQLVWLWSRRYAQLGLDSLRLCQSGCAGDLRPGLKGLGPGSSILIGGDVIAAEVEQIVNPVMGGEKALRLAG